MQDCFRLHPEVYGEELADDEEAAAGADGAETEGVSARNASAEGTSAEDAAAVESSSPSKEATKTGEVKPEGEKAVPKSSPPATKPSDAKTTTTK